MVTDTDTDDPESGDARAKSRTNPRDRPDTPGEILRGDGGQVSSPFETTSEVQETKWNRYRKQFDKQVTTPLSIMVSDWRAIVGLIIVGGYVFAGTVLAAVVEPTRSAEGPQFVQPFQTWEFPLGTNQMGHDLFAQTIHSTGPVLVMMASGAVFTVVTGCVFGLLAGYKGGTVDTILTSITDVFINIPGLPLVIVLSLLFEPKSPVLIGVLLSVAAWAGLARALRSQVLTLREESFIEAARAMDVSTPTILSKEILPHLLPYIMINLANAARNIIFAAVALYYLGVLPFSNTNWGVMLNQAYTSGAVYRPQAIHWMLIPMIAVAGISIGLILISQSLDRVFNPRVRAKHTGTGDETADEAETQSSTMMGQV